MKIAYLINQYPKVSHSFIRREIQELENMGVKIQRYSIRRSEDELVEIQDKQELDKTHFILNISIRRLLINVFEYLFLNPLTLFRL